MTPASSPRPVSAIRLFVAGSSRLIRASSLADALEPGDLVVLNDAATLPASLPAHFGEEPVELRLVSVGSAAGHFTAALLGRGDYRTPTENRPLPPFVQVDSRFVLAGDLTARVVAISAISPRLLELCFSVGDRPEAELYAAIYAAGRPVQYAHVADPIALWDVQNVWASRPWAVEMPSAGRGLRAETLIELRKRGVSLARVTHAAGISATGDAAIDAALPLPERWSVPRETGQAIQTARLRGGRVVAIGTSVVRALESAARFGGTEGVTDLRIGPRTQRLVVDGVVTGLHEIGTTHFSLLSAFASEAEIQGALGVAERAHLYSHEFGDVCLVWGNTAQRLTLLDSAA